MIEALRKNALNVRQRPDALWIADAEVAELALDLYELQRVPQVSPAEFEQGIRLGGFAFFGVPVRVHEALAA